MFRILLSVCIFAIATSSAFAGGSFMELFFSQNHSSDEINRRDNGKSIQVDTSVMDSDVKRNATINRGLNAIGLPSLMGPPKVQKRSVWVKGHGFVDITEQAQRQVDADFRRASSGAAPQPTNTQLSKSQRTTTANQAIARPPSPIQPTVDLLRFTDSVDLVDEIDFESIQLRALQSLMTDSMKFHSDAFKSQQSAMEQELSTLNNIAIVEELLAGLDLPSLTFVGGSRSKTGGLEVRVIESDRPDDEPITVSIKPENIQGQTKWIIEDLTIPSKHLSLLNLYQFRLIESLPQMPTLAAWMHPGRLEQSHQVSLLLSADPSDAARFPEIWHTLREDTKTWSLAQFKLARYESLRVASQPRSRH